MVLWVVRTTVGALARRVAAALVGLVGRSAVSIAELEVLAALLDRGPPRRRPPRSLLGRAAARPGVLAPAVRFLR